MKRSFWIMLAIAMLYACQKDTFPLTMDGAIKKVEKIIEKYPDRDWYASEYPISPRTVLQYSSLGVVWDRPELMNEYVSPPYKAWLIVLAEDPYGGPDSEKCLHLFVDADTGKVEQIWLNGRVIVEWGSDPFSRWLGMDSIASRWEHMTRSCPISCTSSECTTS